MGLREKLNEKPALGVVVMAAAVLIAAVVLYRQYSGGAGTAPTRAFYTDDEGATYFVDAIGKPVPFDRRGRTAYRAWVFQCGEEKPFVAFVGRDSTIGQLDFEDDIPTGLVEIKRVGADERSWVVLDGFVEQRLFSTVPCPSGEFARPVAP